jgi:general stress protein 26
MPGCGLLKADEGSGLLPWWWAEERLIASRIYWLVSVWPDGRRHAMPVWGLWHEGTFWFSSSNGSRKARNFAGDPRCVVMTEDAMDPVVMEGTAELVTEPAALATILALENTKYETRYTIDLLDPSVNSVYRVRPLWAFGLRHDDITGSPPAGASRNADGRNRRERRSLP